MRKRVYAVLLNWRGWQDTIACLETLFASRDIDLCAIVCDNASGDGSLARIAQWADGELEAPIPEQPRLARLFSNTGRPRHWQQLERASASSFQIDATADLVLVDNGANLGFAAGNNVGMRLALAQSDADCVWLLNNDTLVEPDCLAQMRSRLRLAGDRAVCGSVIHFFDKPDVIQAVGGNRFNTYTGVAGCSEGRFLDEAKLCCAQSAAHHLAYLSGCSMLIPRAVLEEVGLLGEDYFLYYEEIDWFTRNNNRFPMVIAGRAKLYHREGSAIGSAGWGRTASAFADSQLYRSRLIFMRKYYPWRLPLCYLIAATELTRKLIRGDHANVRAVLSVLTGMAEQRVPG